MIFKYIELKNFKSYGDYTTRLNLDINESQLLLGTNGMGKTTFIDAIIWGLYGKSMSNVNDIVNRETKKNCKVEVCFTKNGVDYSIIRYRNHEEFKNNILVFKERNNVSPRTANEAQAMILEIIEINYDAMVSSIIFSSELYISFLRATPSIRLKIFENILSLKQIKEYYEVVKKLRKPILEKISDFTGQADRCSQEIDITNINITEYKTKVKNTLLELKEERNILSKEKDGIESDKKTISFIDIESEIANLDKKENKEEHNLKIEKKIAEKELQLNNNITVIANEIVKLKNDLDALLIIDVKEE